MLNENINLALQEFHNIDKDKQTVPNLIDIYNDKIINKMIELKHSIDNSLEDEEFKKQLKEILLKYRDRFIAGYEKIIIYKYGSEEEKVIKKLTKSAINKIEKLQGLNEENKQILINNAIEIETNGEDRVNGKVTNEQLAESMQKIFNNLLKKIKNFNKLLFKKIKDIFKKLINGIKRVFNISSDKEIMREKLSHKSQNKLTKNINLKRSEKDNSDNLSLC